MRSISASARRTLAISRRKNWTRSYQPSSGEDVGEGIDTQGSPRTHMGGIHPPCETPFHVRINHRNLWLEKTAIRSQAISKLYSNQQSRTLFSFLQNDKYDDETDNDTSKTKLSMPSRQSKDDRTHQQMEEAQQLKYQVQTTKQQMHQLLDSPIGSFPWSELQPLLLTLCEDLTIRYAFDLLDRAAKEPDAGAKLTHEMVYLVVQQWLSAYIEQKKNVDKPHYNNHSHHRNHGHQQNNKDKEESKKLRMLSPLNVWKRVQNYQTKGIPLESPTYHKIMEGTTHVKSKIFNNPNGPLLAETILDKMMQESKHKNPLIRPSAYPFTVAMLSWEQAAAYSTMEASKEAPQRALALLNKLKSLYNSGWGNEFMPDKNAYRRVMNIFAHRGDGDQVEALLEDLYALYLDHYEQGHENSHLLMPTTPFFSLVLYSWSKSRDPDAAERAEAILEHMLEMEERGDIPNLKVQSNFFNIVMVCWSKQRTLESAAKVQSTFDRLVEFSKTDPTKQPVGASYMALIKTWSRFDPAKAEEAFWRWKDENDNGRCEMRIESDLIRTLVSSWCKSNESNAAEQSDGLVRFAMKEPEWEPTTFVANMVINKWCQEKTLEGLERAQDLLESMIAYHEAHPGSETKPDNLTYLPIVRFLSEIGQLERAEELLVDFFSQRREGNDASASTSNSSKSNYLDTRIFNCVLKGWLQQASKLPEAVVRAEGLLLSTQFYGVKPNYASFQYVLDAWRKNRSSFSSPWNSNSVDAPKAEAILALLEHEYGKAETKKELYLNLRKGWKLLSVQ